MAQPRLTSADIAARARALGLDAAAVLSVAQQEGLGGGIGDSGHAFGPFQLNDAGGVITGKFPGQSQQQLQDWAWSPQGVDYALGGINKVAHGLAGPDAVRAIVSQFERPADIPGEIARALGQPAPVMQQLAQPQQQAPQASSPVTAALAQQQIAPPPDTRAQFAQALLGGISSTGQLDQHALLQAIQARHPMIWGST